MKQRKIVSHICRVAAILICFSGTLHAYGNTVSFDNANLWFANKECSVTGIEDAALNGYMRYYFEQNSLYCRISYSLSDQEMSSDSSVVASIKNDNRSYSISFSENSEDDFYCNINKCFTEQTALGQEILFMLEFTDKEDKNVVNSIDILLKISGRNHHVTTVTSPYIYDTETATDNTAPSAKTTADYESKNETTTKFVYSGGYSSYSVTQSNENETVTKFSADSNRISDNNSAHYDSESEYSAEPYDESDSNNGEISEIPVEKVTELSPEAKAMYALASLFAVCGSALLIQYAVKTKAKQKIVNEENADTEKSVAAEKEAEISEDVFDLPKNKE